MSTKTNQPPRMSVHMPGTVRPYPALAPTNSTKISFRGINMLLHFVSKRVEDGRPSMMGVLLAPEGVLH